MKKNKKTTKSIDFIFFIISLAYHLIEVDYLAAITDIYSHVAEWFRYRSAKPFTAVRVRP